MWQGTAKYIAYTASTTHARAPTEICVTSPNEHIETDARKDGITKIRRRS